MNILFLRSYQNKRNHSYLVWKCFSIEEIIHNRKYATIIFFVSFFPQPLLVVVSHYKGLTFVLIRLDEF